MPNFALHVLMASRVADEWRAWPRQAPFDPAVRVNMNAFLHGCVGPDMGMFPGGDPLISGLVHRVRTGRLTRALLAGARNAPERAFAWGWLTHVLADGMVHPLVNATAARSLGRGEVLGDDLQGLAHVRVEMGLDAAYTARHAELLRVRLTPAFDARGLGWFRRALRETYGATFGRDGIARSHRAVVRFHRPVLAIARFAARRWPEQPAVQPHSTSPRGDPGAQPHATLSRGDPGAQPHATLSRGDPGAPADLIAMRPFIGALRWAMLRAGARSELSALLDPLRPPPALRAGVDRILRLFPRVVRDYEETAFATLADLDLETGVVENPWQPTHAAVSTLRALVERGLVVEGHPALAEAA